MTLMLRHNPLCVQRLFASSAEHGLTPEEDRQRWDGLVVSPLIVLGLLCLLCCTLGGLLGWELAVEGGGSIGGWRALLLRFAAQNSIWGWLGEGSSRGTEERPCHCNHFVLYLRESACWHVMGA